MKRWRMEGGREGEREGGMVRGLGREGGRGRNGWSSLIVIPYSADKVFL